MTDPVAAVFAVPFPVALPIAFLLLQGAVLALWPTLAGKVACVFMVKAPLLAAALWRGRAEAQPVRRGWGWWPSRLASGRSARF